MKRRNLLRKVKNFLEHLESNVNNPEKRRTEILERSFPPKKQLSDIIDFCHENRLIKTDLVPRKGNVQYSITIHGLEFIERQRQKDRDKEAHKFQRLLVITSLILAMGVSFNAISQTEILFKKASLTLLLIGILTLTLYVLISFIKRK